MATIIPAILEETKEGFLQKLSLIVKVPGVQRVQIDFGDGRFIPKKLLEAAEMDVLNPAIHWEAHLMLKEPKDFLDYQICGFKTLIVHYEAYQSADALKRALAEIKQMGFDAGVAINPTTDVVKLKDFSGRADQFLLMSVTPGQQGQEFIPQTIERIKQLRRLIPGAIIEIDGGVNANNVAEAAGAGADLIVAGSAIVNAADPAAAFEKLSALAIKPK